MGQLRCVDGSRLEVLPVPARDRGGTPFEVTLEVRHDGCSFGVVGERCGYFLALLATRLDAARDEASPQARHWPDAADRFPDPLLAVPPPGADAAGPTGREPELFAFRHRERADMTGAGELRCTVRTSCVWRDDADPRRGEWRRARRAVVEAWDAGGHGVRAVVTSGELAGFVTGLVREAAQVGADYGDVLHRDRKVPMGSPVNPRHTRSRAIIDY